METRSRPRTFQTYPDGTRADGEIYSDKYGALRTSIPPTSVCSGNP
jgi:hypothetical protein